MINFTLEMEPLLLYFSRRFLHGLFYTNVRRTRFLACTSLVMLKGTENSDNPYKTFSSKNMSCTEDNSFEFTKATVIIIIF